MLAVVPQPTFRSLPLRAPDRRARRCTEPSLGADRPSPEHKPAAAPRLLSRTRPSGEVVPRAQARVVQREVRDRRITARGVKPNALALLGRSCPPTTPHRFLLVGGSRRCVMTSITWIGIRGRSRSPIHFEVFLSNKGFWQIRMSGLARDPGPYGEAGPHWGPLKKAAL